MLRLKQASGPDIVMPDNEAVANEDTEEEPNLKGQELSGIVQ